MQNPVFSAGDLIGIYVSFRNNIQQCEAFIPAGTGATGSAFFPFAANNTSGISTLIGAAPASHTNSSIGLHWDGAIDMLILGDGRVVTSANNRLNNQHKRSWYPMWVGTEALNGIGGTAPFTPFLVIDFMQGHPGDTVSTLIPRVGGNCTATGDPEAGFTRMMY